MLEGIKNPQISSFPGLLAPAAGKGSRPWPFPVAAALAPCIPCISYTLYLLVSAEAEALNLWEAGIGCSLLVACIAGVSFRLVFAGFFLQ